MKYVHQTVPRKETDRKQGEIQTGLCFLCEVTGDSAYIEIELNGMQFLFKMGKGFEHYSFHCIHEHGYTS